MRLGLAFTSVSPAVGAILAVLGTSSLASADEATAAQKETARALMDAGHACDDRGDHRAALESFLAADALVHVPTTAYEVAAQQEALHLLVEARDTALRITRLPVGPNEPPPFVTARQNAQALADALAPRIPSLQVAVANVESAHAQVAIDGMGIPVAALGAAFKVNPGHHIVTAVDGARRVEREVDVAEGSVTPVTLALPAAPPAGPTASDAAPSASAAGIVFRWGGLGLAVAGVAVGTAGGLVSLSATSSAKAYCDGGRCGSGAAGDLQSAQTAATFSDIGFVAAGIGAVAFVVSFALRVPKTPPSRAGPFAVHIEPWIGLGDAGLRGAF